MFCCCKSTKILKVPIQDILLWGCGVAWPSFSVRDAVTPVRINNEIPGSPICFQLVMVLNMKLPLKWNEIARHGTFKAAKSEKTMSSADFFHLLIMKHANQFLQRPIKSGKPTIKKHGRTNGNARNIRYRCNLYDHPL